MSPDERRAPLFPRLPGGRGALPPEHALAHRRGRLKGAMVAAVAEHGYEAVTVEELVALAGVSKRDFYAAFASKEECFWATFEEIVALSQEAVGAAYQEGTGPRGKLLSALDAYGRLLVEQPAAARLVAVDSFSLGTAGVAPREAAEARYAELLRRSLAQAPERGEIPEVTIRGIIGGVLWIVYRRLREDRPERFAGDAEALLDWGLGYQRHDPRPVLGEEFFAALASDGEGASPDELPGGEPEGAELTARERIVRAVADLAAAKGYSGLSMPAIAAAAAVSNRTFYREFADKQEAFLAAFDIQAERAYRHAEPAIGADARWPETVGRVLAATLAFIAADPLYARLAFFELAAAGPAGRDHAEQATRRFLGFLSPTAAEEGVVSPPKVVVEAIGGGIWTVVQSEIAAGRAGSLPALAPELADFALRPFGVEGQK